VVLTIGRKWQSNKIQKEKEMNVLPISIPFTSRVRKTLSLHGQMLCLRNEMLLISKLESIKISMRPTLRKKSKNWRNFMKSKRKSSNQDSLIKSLLKVILSMRT